MVDEKHAIAYSEVLEIIKYIDEDDYKKIPQEYIDVLEKYSYKNSKFRYNPNKTLDEQNVSEISKIMIAIFFRDYWANEKQKEKIIRFQRNKRQKIEDLKSEKYNVENLFKNSSVSNNENEKEEIALMEIKEEKKHEKIFSFIKKIFKK